MEALKVIQLSDPHLFGDPDGVLRDVVTRDSLQSVIDQVQERETPFDVVLVTGDLAQDESYEAYAALAQALASFDVPVLCLPGNHDEPEYLRAHLNTAPMSCEPLHRFGGWDFHLVSTRVAGMVHGQIADDDKSALEARLRGTAAGRFSVVWLHHPPFAVGCHWLDNSRLQDAPAFLEMCRKAQSVRAIFCGHVHQAFEARHGDMVLASAPSTCAQFKPDSDDYALDDRPPGYRVSRFFEDGRVETQVRWVTG